MLGEIHTTDVVLNTSCFALLYRGEFGGGVAHVLLPCIYIYHTFKFCMCYNSLVLVPFFAILDPPLSFHDILF